MNTSTQNFLSGFAMNSLKDDLETFVDDGIAELQVLFEDQGLELTNQRDDIVDKYIAVSRPGVDCPLLVKAVTGKDPVRLLGYIVVPDSGVALTLSELRSFCETYFEDEDFDSIMASCTARMLGADIRTKFAQAIQRQEAVEERNRQRMKGFLKMSDEDWSVTRLGFLDADSEDMRDFALLVDKARAKLKVMGRTIE